MGTNRWLKYKIELLPIKVPTAIEEMEITRIVEQIISIKKTDVSADTSGLENEIDQLVYKLYNLTEEEIKIVEGK